jgi:hypothetical protein
MSQQPHLPHIDEAPSAVGPVTPTTMHAAPTSPSGCASTCKTPLPRHRGLSALARTRRSWRCPTRPTTPPAPTRFCRRSSQSGAVGRSGTSPYHREPFAADVSEGKNDPIYNAHSYHTKVPHKAIMRYILHYTEPGDIVFDGFCGSGMTGVAAQLCGDRKAVQEPWLHGGRRGRHLRRLPASSFIVPPSSFPISRLGPRKAVLNDLSPAATFIAYNYNTPVDTAAFETRGEAHSGRGGGRAGLDV